MTTAPDLLPNDPNELRALLLAERARHAAELMAARSQAEEEIARLRQIIQELQRHRFGRRAERLDPDQLALALEDLEQTLADWVGRAAWHLRFYDLQTGGSAPTASEALLRIAKLYAVEAQIRGRDAETRRRERQARSAPLVAELKAWLEKQLAAVSRKSTLAEAIRYALSRWKGLALFLDDSRVEIDSNSVERCIRPLAIARPFCPCRDGC